ncbi:hypothetical protein PR048_006043 [Dryococelus australis]|uniref:PiggyBac transposable element-derived protein domain-containing protein n=1 Tax=Dryococelus australis TaxID=614101 RepID=A0ABQ9I9V3_9NEOP|nr:hypothetical protein PR048_006043 [Dryococelus australis]
MMYGGEITFCGYLFSPEEEQLGMSGKVVVALCKSIPNSQCQIVYFDNFFCSIELNQFLRDDYGIFGLGTLRANPLRGCTLKTCKQLSTSGRGSYDQKVEDIKKVGVVKWYDNRAVVLASSYVASNIVTAIKVDIGFPAVVIYYNTHGLSRPD